jgi:hypothetical protein
LTARRASLQIPTVPRLYFIWTPALRLDRAQLAGQGNAIIELKQGKETKVTFHQKSRDIEKYRLLGAFNPCLHLPAELPTRITTATATTTTLSPEKIAAD